MLPVFLAGLFCFAATSFAEAEVVVETSVDRSKITIGDPIALSVKITRSADDRLLNDRQTIQVKPFEIIDSTLGQEQTIDDRIVTEDLHRISIYEVGEHHIPPIKMAYLDAEGEEHEAESTEHRIMVVSVATDLDQAQDVRDLKEPLVIGQSIQGDFD